MNSITVAGSLGKDAELRALPDGTQVLNFSVADSQGRDKPTIWWNCQLFGKRAGSLQQYLVKGQAVTVSGNIAEREWTSKEGEKRKSMDVRVNDVALQGGQRQSGDASPAQQDKPAHRQAPAPAPKPSSGGSGFDDMNSDIPF
ncbi:single-stranded DNA-binding protein [Undibacterium sp.]|uniref:single-stranded DNA-binding protein n=1 Tax=Undibacterium sp. TaxID=1914977 RepID=UPI003751D983